MEQTPIQVYGYIVISSLLISIMWGSVSFGVYHTPDNSVGRALTSFSVTWIGAGLLSVSPAG